MFEDTSEAQGLRVIRAGVHSTIQDLGRYGYAGHGLSQGGPMDLQAHCWVNRLLNNIASDATIEITVGMASFRAECDLVLALGGADLQAELDSELIGNWRSFVIKRGQTLKLQPARKGLRAYLGIKGGVQTESMMGSCSTVVRNGLGSAIVDGDLLSAASHHAHIDAHVPPRYLPSYPETITLRVIESYQARNFSPQALKVFYQSEYELSADSNRMGARLEGESIDSPNEGIISEGIALGSIQVPSDGQPIVLLNDRQTLGGYPKLGVVARVDLPQLGQARPGTKVRFSPIALSQARREWCQFCDYFSGV
ncbi:MAG: biotin-dependent carboxyltransferase family protein [Akkermansiaceae bacterium]|nr:biotin-dependent carboxyltransferase family protein [Akkermansiaceae bacterium]